MPQMPWGCNVPCPGLDQGGEFFWGMLPSPPRPSWNPGQEALVPYPDGGLLAAQMAIGPVVILRVKQIFIFTGPIDRSMYVGTSVNTDPNLSWFNHGGDVNHQDSVHAPEDLRAFDMGGQYWYYDGGRVTDDHHWEACPYVVYPTDGFVVSAVAPLGSGQIVEMEMHVDWKPLNSWSGPVMDRSPL